jgi:hypothetical protein
MLSIAQGVVQAKERSREEEEMIWKKRTQKMDDCSSEDSHEKQSQKQHLKVNFCCNFFPSVSCCDQQQLALYVSKSNTLQLYFLQTLSLQHNSIEASCIQHLFCVFVIPSHTLLEHVQDA